MSQILPSLKKTNPLSSGGINNILCSCGTVYSCEIGRSIIKTHHTENKCYITQSVVEYETGHILFDNISVLVNVPFYTTWIFSEAIEICKHKQSEPGRLLSLFQYLEPNQTISTSTFTIFFPHHPIVPATCIKSDTASLSLSLSLPYKIWLSSDMVLALSICHIPFLMIPHIRVGKMSILFSKLMQSNPKRPRFQSDKYQIGEYLHTRDDQYM